MFGQLVCRVGLQNDPFLFINGTLNGERYQNFLEQELPLLLEGFLDLEQFMWIQHG